jgi:hypothetical protein
MNVDDDPEEDLPVEEFATGKVENRSTPPTQPSQRQDPNATKNATENPFDIRQRVGALRFWTM